MMTEISHKGNVLSIKFTLTTEAMGCCTSVSDQEVQSGYQFAKKNYDKPPLVCACHLDSADYLNCGANSNGHWLTQEAPLHYFADLELKDMEAIAGRFLSAGAIIDISSGGMLHGVGNIRADWEHMKLQ